MNRRYLSAAAVMVAAFAVVAALSVGTRQSSAPLADDTVVATAAQSATFSDALRDLLLAARPDDAPTSARLAAARGLINEGRTAGDARIVGAALGVLGPLLRAPEPGTEALILAATARQYQHDFQGALGLLDQALKQDPRNLAARLERATIATVQGRFRDAVADCQAVSNLNRPELGFICQATTMVLGKDAPMLAERLTRMLARADLFGPELRPVVMGLLGEMAVARGDKTAAVAHFRRASEADPKGLRLRLQLSDALLANGQPEEIAVVLDGQPPVDGVLLRQAIAAKTLGDGNALASVQEELDSRFLQNIALELGAHAREEAIYFLHVAGDPALALERAKVNWALQHEYEDALILVEAARAAGQPEAATPVADWMAEEGLLINALGISPSPGAAP